jgi:hypothetical protein
LPKETEFFLALSDHNLGKFIPQKIHKVSVKFSLKFIVTGIISFYLQSNKKKFNFANENNSLLSSRQQLKYEKGCASAGLFPSDTLLPFLALLSVSGDQGLQAASQVSWLPPGLN